MGWGEWPYWIRGGIIFVVLGILLLPLLFLFGYQMSDGIIQIFYLPLFTSMFGGRLVLIILGLFLTLAMYFGIGALQGAVYSKFTSKITQVLFILFLLVIWLVLMSWINNNMPKQADLSKAYTSSTSVEDCRVSKNKYAEAFNINLCYQWLAEKNMDITICDNIEPLHSEKTQVADDFKWFCYEQIAHVKHDSSICNFIPEETFNEYVQTHRKQGCLGWFAVK